MIFHACSFAFVAYFVLICVLIYVVQMNKYTQFAILSVSTLRMLPHILLYLCYKNVIDADLIKYGDKKGNVINFIKVCTRQQVFRNLFYYRMGEYKTVFIKWLLPPEHSLNIWCPHIGKGCHFEHNYSTYLNAESIGDNFYCLHLVTIGNSSKGRPTIGNNVKVFTGATIYGNIHIGNNVTIGAGTIVDRDIPDNHVVKAGAGIVLLEK